MAAASGCSLACSTLAQAAAFPLRRTRHGDDSNDSGFAFGKRAGLVDHDGIDLLHAFQRLGILISTPACAPRPTPTMMDIGVASPAHRGRR